MTYKILIISPSWVGDMMMSQALYRTLKANQPNCQIDVLAPAWCEPLLAKMPEVHRSIVMPIGHGEFNFKQRKALAQQFKAEQYDQAIVLPNSLKSALIPFLAKIPKRTGWKGEMRYFLINDRRQLDKQAFPLMVERYIALAYEKNKIKSAADLPKPLLYPKLSVNEAEIQQNLQDFKMDLTKKQIGFCPGAEFGPAKRWPDYHYAALAFKFIQLGYQILIFGSVKDAKVGDAIMQQVQALSNSSQLNQNQLNNILNLAGKTNLNQAVNLIAHCESIITNDSGLMHVAASLDRPLITLYGPSSPDFTPPLSDKAIVIRLITGYHKVRKGDQASGYHQSLIDISPELVFEKWQALMQSDVIKKESNN